MPSRPPRPRTCSARDAALAVEVALLEPLPAEHAATKRPGGCPHRQAWGGRSGKLTGSQGAPPTACARLRHHLSMRTLEYRVCPTRAQRQQLITCLSEPRATCDEVPAALKAHHETSGTV